MADGVDVSLNVVFNSPLCYVLTKIKTLETVRIRSILIDHYCAEDISSAKRALLESTSCIQFDKPLPRYPDRHGVNRTARGTEDIIDILQRVDERKMLNTLPKFVTDNSDSLPSPRSDECELRTLMNKIRNLEAILFRVQVAMQQSVVLPVL